jgi:predicted dehydrogenase
VKKYFPGAELFEGISPVALATQPGADVAQLREDVFGRFISVQNAEVSDADALTAELTHFVKCVQTNSTPLVNGWTALRALEIADRIQQAVAEHVWNPAAGSSVGPRILAASGRTDRKAA